MLNPIVLLATEPFILMRPKLDDVDLHEKLVKWEAFYNCHRSHLAHAGKTLYEVLKNISLVFKTRRQPSFLMTHNPNLTNFPVLLIGH
ncbi:Uncharacterised protein [Providencia stuartii]|nr:integrase domain protein [Providencia stuartii]SPY67333.1 Uncharacterised protein [Providencia stuartii]